MVYCNNPLSTLAISCSISSLISSFSVVLTGIIFPTMMKKLFMRMIMFISACDFIASLVYSFGFVKASSILCPIQGSFATFFYHASFFWAVCLSYQTYSLIILNKLSLYEYQMHAIVWTLSFLVLLLPLTDSDYGQDDEISGNAWCSLYAVHGNRIGEQYWGLFSVTIPIYICIGIIISIYLRIKYFNLYIAPFTDHDSLKIMKTANSLLWYPLIMAIFWTPILIISTDKHYNKNYDQTALSVSWSFSALFGAALSFTYFMNSPEARRKWYQLLFQNKMNDIDMLIQVHDFDDIEEYESSHRDTESQILMTVRDSFRQSFNTSFSFA